MSKLAVRDEDPVAVLGDAVLGESAGPVADGELAAFAGDFWDVSEALLGESILA